MTDNTELRATQGERDRCLKCGHVRVWFQMGHCQGCGCHCVFPNTQSPDRCPVCGHSPHVSGGCLNMASDNDCDCKTGSLQGEEGNSSVDEERKSEMRAKAPSHSQTAIPKDNSVSADSPFRAGTGLMGATDTGQRVTKDNAHFLPPGSVVRLDDDNGVLIHLHGGLWYWNAGCAWCYDTIDRHKSRLPGTLCHLPVSLQPEQ